MNDDLTSPSYNLKILQISDLHFGPPFMPEVAEAALRSAHSLVPDLLVVSGDLTQRARREQFEAAREYLSRFPSVPRVVIPGNHDVPLYDVARRLSDPHMLYREIISQELNSIVQVDGAMLIGLDSTAPRSAITNGRIRGWQLDFCEKAFEKCPPDAIKIVVAHHHFAPAPDLLRDRSMPKAQRAMTRFAKLGVEMILGGHLHRAYIGNSLDFYPGELRDRGIIIVQSGTTTSRRGRGREREKNTFNVIELGSRTIKITHYLYFDSEHGFVANSQHEFRRWPTLHADEPHGK